MHESLVCSYQYAWRCSGVRPGYQKCCSSKLVMHEIGGSETAVTTPHARIRSCNSKPSSVQPIQAIRAGSR